MDKKVISIYLHIMDQNKYQYIKERINDLFVNQPYQFIEHITPHNSALCFIEFNKVMDIRQYEAMKIMNNNHTFICLSQKEELVFESLCLFPLQFIRYSSFEEDVEIALDRIKVRFINEHLIAFKTSFGSVDLNPEHIVYIETYGHTQIIHTKTMEYPIRNRLTNILDIIDYPNLIQIHKSFVVNKNYITAISSNQVTLNHISLPIGRKYKENINTLHLGG